MASQAWNRGFQGAFKSLYFSHLQRARMVNTDGDVRRLAEQPGATGSAV